MAQKALDFDGIDNVVTIAAAASLANIFDGTGGSAEAWIKPDSDGEGDSGRICGKTSGWAFYISLEAAGMAYISFYQFCATTAGVWRSTNREVTIGAWNYVVVTYDADDVANDPILYVNGSPVAITETGIPDGARLDDTTRISYIGNNSVGNRCFDGIIDEVRLSTKIRSQAEITAIWNGGAGLQFEADGDTVALWHMNEGADVTIFDETVNDNDGTITGASWVDGYDFTQQQKTSSDTGSGVEALTQTVLLVKAETGVGVEALTQTVLLVKAETGVGVEALGDRIFDAAESGAGVDASLLLAALIGADTGLGLDELIALTKAIIALDYAIGTDRLIALIRTLSKGSDIKLPSGTPGETAIPPGEVSIPSFEVHL